MKKVLVVDDERLIRWSVVQRLTAWGYEVIEAEDAASGVEQFAQEAPDLVLLDVALPDRRGTEVLKDLKASSPATPVILVTAHGILEEAVDAMRAGAFHFLPKPINFEQLQITLQNALEVSSLRQEVTAYKEREKKQFEASSIVAESPAMAHVVELLYKIARSEASLVLLTGESGAGKDLLSHALHDMSRRSARPFLAINCSSIPENLLETELFGYEKGAFTDARSQKKGQMEIADGGTVLLDEIGEMALGLQSKFLRFLEERTFKRVGGLRDVSVDVRIVAATNRDLETDGRDGRFRMDLYYRLSILPIKIPPLRERREDIIPLANRFIRMLNIKLKKNALGLTPDAEKKFLAYHWPGNVRELRNAIERAIILEDSERLDASAFLLDVPVRVVPAESVDLFDGNMGLDEVEKYAIEKALKAADGNQSRAARMLKITRDRLRYKMRKHRLGQDAGDGG